MYLVFIKYDYLNSLHQKNKPGKIIIVYDEDERVAPHVATVMVQKDVDNVLMLSGGTEQFLL